MNSAPTTQPTTTSNADLLARFNVLMDVPAVLATRQHRTELIAVCDQVIGRGGYDMLCMLVAEEQAAAVDATLEYEGRKYYPQAGDLLPAVIDTEGVDALRLSDQFERTINAHRARGTATRYGATRWMRLVEAADRFAHVAGVVVG